MESISPYLDAIQRIPGNTSKEKHQYLDTIVQQTIQNKNAPSDFGFQVPDALKPLIEVEIARISKNTDDVIVALKSDDVTIVNRALKADWLFDGTNKSVTNFHYFSTHILPFVSLKTRKKIIKSLSQHLARRNDYTTGEEFFQGLKNSINYDSKLAMLLLPACKENYIFEFIKGGNVRVSVRLIKRLFPKYPELVIKYFKSLKPASDDKKVSLLDYVHLLPKLIKNHLHDFIKFFSSLKVHEFDLNLGNNSTKLFLKTEGIEALLQHTRKYFPILSLKSITTKLDRQQFRLFFRNLFPKTKKEFSTSEILGLLKFQPQEKKLDLLMKTFKDLYGEDLTSSVDDVTSELLLLLPKELRIEIAQKKLKAQSGKPNNYFRECLLCYLSTEDSISKVKKIISKAERKGERNWVIDLVPNLIYTCKVNDSKDDLLSVLRYITTNHRNENSYFWTQVARMLTDHFELTSLSAEHWGVLLEIIQISSKDIPNFEDPIRKLLENEVHYNLLNSIPIEHQLTRLLELEMKKGTYPVFNFLTDHPDFEKHCLKKFIEIISHKFPDGHPNCEERDLINMIGGLLQSLYNYNQRVTKAASKKQQVLKNEELLFVADNPRLLQQVKNAAFDDRKHDSFLVEEVKNQLQEHEPKLYYSWFPSEETIVDVSKSEGWKFLREDHQKILQNWKKHFKTCERNISWCYPHTRKFLRDCTWYSEIPVKFVQECLKKLDEKDPRTVDMLSFLLRGPEFAEVIRPLVPVLVQIDIRDEGAWSKYRGTASLLPAINRINPPPPLELVSQLCQGDYLSLGLICLTNVARRVPVTKVILFAKTLIDKPVSVRKHGIRLLCDVTPTEELCGILENLWKTEKHESIRQVIFEKGHDLFTNRPCQNTWRLMDCLIDGITAEDITTEDNEYFGTLEELSIISNEYVKDYFEKLLNKIEQLVELGMNQKSADKMILRLLRRAGNKVCANFPEKYCRFLLRKFTFESIIDGKFLGSGSYCPIGSFLLSLLLEAGDYLESRLSYFHEVIKKRYDQVGPEKFKSFFIERILRQIVEDIVETEKHLGIDLKILESMMELFSSVLEPEEAPKNYLLLFFMIGYKKAGSDMMVFGLTVVRKLPELLDFYSLEMIYQIGEVLLSFLRQLEKKSKFGNLIGSLAQVLAEEESVYSNILAAVFIKFSYVDIEENVYGDILRKLREVRHPLVEFILNVHASDVRFGAKTLKNL